MKIQGILPAVLTPFTAAGRVDLNRFAAHVDRLYAAGVDGIYAGGNAGEWYALSLDDRKALTRAAVELSQGRGLAVIHVGALRLEESIELARHAEAVGAAGVSSLPPYAQSWSLDEVRSWFERIAAATDLPFFVYYFPRLTGGAAGSIFFDAMRPLSRIAGYKFTDLNLFDLGLLLQESYTVFNGHDPNLCAALRMGAHGGIGSYYNVVPELVVRLHRAVKGEDTAYADQLQARINRIIQLIRGYRLIPALKHLSRIQGFDQGVLREPMLPLTQAEETRIAEQWESIACAR